MWTCGSRCKGIYMLNHRFILHCRRWVTSSQLTLTHLPIPPCQCSPHINSSPSTSQRLGNFPTAPQSVNLLYLHIWPATCPRHMAQLNRHPLHQSGSPHDLKVTSQVGRGTWLPLHHLLENPSGRHRNYCIDPWQDSDENPVFVPFLYALASLAFKLRVSE